MGTRLRRRGHIAVAQQKTPELSKLLSLDMERLVRPVEIPETWAEWVQNIDIKSGSRVAKMQPMDWQRKAADLIINRSSGKRKSYIFAKSRQAGASTLVFSVVDFLCLTKPRFTALFLHKTFNDANELGARNIKFLRDAGVPLVSEAKSKQVLPNGSMLYYRSSDPDTAGRGLDSIDVVVYEECAFYKDLNGTIEAIAPAQSWCDEAISLFVTTPNGKIGNRYWELLSNGEELQLENKLAAIRNGAEEPFQILEEDKPQTRIIVHWRAVDRYRDQTEGGGFKQSIMKQSGVSEKSFSQEYDLDFTVDESSSIFDFAMVRGCARAFDEPTTSTKIKPRTFAGIDAAAAGNDYTVCTILESFYLNDVEHYRIIAQYRRRTGTSEQHMAAIASLLEKHKVERTYCETNSMGQLYLERLSAALPSMNIEGWATTQTSKELLIGRLTLALESTRVFFDPGSPTEAELLSYRRVGKKYEAASGCHDDSVIALALALSASDFSLELGPIMSNLDTAIKPDETWNEIQPHSPDSEPPSSLGPNNNPWLL